MQKNYQKTYMLANILVAVGVVALGMLMGIIALCTANTQKTRSLEAVYQKSLYEVVENVSNMEVKLSKLVVCKDAAQSAVVLSEVWRQADNAASNLAQLPIEHHTLSRTARFLNQLGDYACCLSKSRINGASVQQKDTKQLQDLHQTSLQLASELELLVEQLNGNMSIYKLSNRGKRVDLMPFSQTFDQMQSQSIDYPAVIYDGPFSDSVTDKPFVYLQQLQDISPQQAQEYATNMFGQNTKYLGEAGGELVTYEFEVGDAYAQITKKGGKLIMFAANRDVTHIELNQNSAQVFAENYAKLFGFEDMQVMWYNQSNGIAYINMTNVQQDVRIYPDMIVVKIALDDGSLMGFNSMEYCKNHTSRTKLAPTISLNTAKSMLSDELNVQSHRLALIPQEGKEVLAYEFCGDYADYTYFVYIDAYNGKQLDIKRLVQNGIGYSVE